jgi:hypothetical protein
LLRILQKRIGNNIGLQTIIPDVPLYYRDEISGFAPRA